MKEAMTGQLKPAAPAAAERQAWLGVLARAPAGLLAETWRRFEPKPAYRRVRGPATGLVLVRGRAGGTGERFNVGEATVTRCTIAFDDGRTGTSYALGRDHDKALHAALFDALLQDPAMRPRIEAELLAPARDMLATAAATAARKAAATRVDFFTMAREASV
jgi:alpha-D-ribose 1-methylphosphonate 5-triphosphate synthase subunit PhnG